MGILWFILISTVSIIVWRLRVKDKREERKNKNQD
jgi:hypothetical protein